MKAAVQRNRVLTVFTPEREGGFMVSFPDYTGCVTYGKTLTEAKRMGREVLELWLEELQADQEPIIPISGALITELPIRFPTE